MGLDEVTQICPVPLPFWLSDSGGKGIQVCAVVHGEAQLADRWGDYGRQVVLDTCSVKVFLPGITDVTTLQAASTLCGQASWKLRGQDHATRHDVATPDMIRQLPAGFALVIRGGCAPVIARLPRAWKNPAYRRARRLGRAPWHRHHRAPRRRGRARARHPRPRARRMAPRSRRHRLPVELMTMPDTDPITAIVDQLAAHAEQLTRLDTREAGHHAAATRRLAELTGQAADIGRIVQEHAAALGRTHRDPAQTGRDADGYHPEPGPAWWKLTADDRQEPVARLRAWVEQVYRPGYGHLAASLGPCWALPRPVPVRPGHPVRAVVGAVPAARPQPRAGLRPGRIPGPHPARPGRPAPHRDQPLRPPPQPRTGRRPALEQAMTDADAPPGPGLRRPRLAGVPLPCPARRSPATRHGFRDATTDPAQITAWFGRHPDWNLAIATGAPGPDVLDVDEHGPAGNGYAAFGQLRNAGLLDGAAAYVRTPSGGLHAYFRGSDQRNGHLPDCHLDFRSRGGYVLAPPSQVDGQPYQLIRTLRADGGLDWAAVTAPATPAPAASPKPHPGPGRGPQRTWPGGSPAKPKATATPACSGPPTAPWTPTRPPTSAPWPPPPARPAWTSREITRTLNSARQTGQPRPPAPGYQAEAGDPS